MDQSNLISFFIFQEKTAFIPLRYVYPECVKLIEPHPQMYPLRCLREDGCPANVQCMDFLVKRVDYLFQEVLPDSDLLIVYYKYKDRPDSIRAAVFFRDLREPKLMTCNKAAFKKFQREGKIFAWAPSGSYLTLGAERNIIPVENLIK